MKLLGAIGVVTVKKLITSSLSALSWLLLPATVGLIRRKTKKVGKRSKARRRHERKMRTMTDTSSEPINLNKSVSKPYRVTLHADKPMDYPQLYHDIYVAGDAYDQKMFAEMFVRAKCKRADTPEKADIVIFTGGADVNPILYGEVPHPSVSYDAKRDEEDIKLFEYCFNAGVPMVGICRGAQFINVMMGGKLIQHLDNHQRVHRLWDVKNKKLIVNASSVHHQAVLPNKAAGMEILADAMMSKERWFNDKDHEKGFGTDIEAYWMRDICALGFQGHPEYRGYEEFTKWCLTQIDEYIIRSVDLETIDGVRRLKKPFLEERDARYKERDKTAGVEVH